MRVGRLVYFGTDPVYPEIAFANGDVDTRTLLAEHDEVVTYGENIGTGGCTIPPLPRPKSRTRQPVLLDLWRSGPPSKVEFTTLANWNQDGRDVQPRGDTYHWSKDREFLKFIDLPSRTEQPIELATTLKGPRTSDSRTGAAVRALGLDTDAYLLLNDKGWTLVHGPDFTADPWRYRDYVSASRAEFTVARDLNVRLRSGWFSERCAPWSPRTPGSRPSCLPTGEGLFAFNTIEEILAAFEAINSDYERHSRAARAIAEAYFRAETVLAQVLKDLGL